MRVRFWGTRGSIASPGPATVRYGGNTSCVEVRSASGTLVVLDAGTGLRGLGLSLMGEVPAARDGHLLIGHTHWDHIQGFPFFAPLFEQGRQWDVYAPRGFGASLRDTLAGQMQYTYFPVSLEAMGADIRYHDLVEGSFAIGDVRVTARYLNHPALTLGYRLEADGVVLVYASDHECHARSASALGAPLSQVLGGLHPGDRRHLDFIAGADLLIHDTQYTAAEYPRHVGWGHSTTDYALQLALAGGVRRLALFHHDPQRDDAALDGMVAACREQVRSRGGSLHVLAAAEGTGIELHAASARVPLPAGQAPAEADPAERPEGAVLLACADVALAQKLREAIEAEGLQVQETGCCADALAAAESRRPAAAIIQRRLDGEDGLTLCRGLRALAGHSDLPVVMVAAANDAPAPALTGGPTEWLAPPFTQQYLRTKLRASLMRSRSRWQKAALPAQEHHRLAALHRLALLDTPPEERFDRLTRLAARMFDVPIALVSLVDAERQWFKSRVGDVAPETSREVSFCAHAILGTEALVVNDALEDDRFADNPLVATQPRLRFYAGRPLVAPDGSAVGTFCLIDHRPRDFSASDLQALGDLATLVERELRPAPSA